MVPKKAKELYKQLAEDNNLSETMIQNIVEFYYSTVKSNMVNLMHPRLDILGLGHFIVKTTTVDKGIIKTERQIAAQDESTFKGYHYKKVLEEKLVNLKRIEQRLLENKELKRKFKEKKNEGSTESNMGEQESNS
jgi:nucleoid DNA-binding protein